jgi:hypothetical protein
MIKRILCISFVTLLSGFSAKASILPKISKKKIENSTPHEGLSIENSSDCHEIIKHIEKQHNLPANLLAAVATIESHKKPWAVNVKGRSHNFSSKEAAVKFIQKKKDEGAKQIYVGCMQICLKSHGMKFKDVDHAITPYHNINYAAKLLKQLYRQYGSWESAVKYYNASLQKESYTDRVFSMLGGRSDVASRVNSDQTTRPLKKQHVRIAFGPGAGVR